MNILEGPDLFQLVRTVIDDVPQDVAGECFDGIHESERLKSGDWLVIWGGELQAPFILILYKLLLTRHHTCVLSVQALPHPQILQYS